MRDRQRPPADLSIEGLSLEQLHGDELRALVLVDFVDGADVRMVERRRRPRLAQEPIGGGFVVGAVRQKELQATRRASFRSSAL